MKLSMFQYLGGHPDRLMEMVAANSFSKPRQPGGFDEFRQTSHRLGAEVGNQIACIDIVAPAITEQGCHLRGKGGQRAGRPGFGLECLPYYLLFSARLATGDADRIGRHLLKLLMGC